MARKRKTGLLEDMLDWVSLMPWWAGVAIAAIGYVVLHRLATPVQATAVQPGQVGSLLAQSPMATPNRPTCGRSNCSRQDRVDYDYSGLTAMRAAASLRR
jgi:hypothetical protein